MKLATGAADILVDQLDYATKLVRREVLVVEVLIAHFDSQAAHFQHHIGIAEIVALAHLESHHQQFGHMKN